MSSMAPPGMGKVMETPMGDDDRLRDSASDAYDVLRDLFLGGDEPREGETPPPVGPDHPGAATTAEVAAPFIDALVLGHLPVLQSAWVMQYARDCAAQRGRPVALLRIRGDETTIDLVGLGSTTVPAQLTSFDEALSVSKGVTAGFILRVDATNEPALAALDTVDTLTLLTGADEVAVLASYQTVKKLFPASDESGPEARLAIMGASPEKAMEAAEKLEKTAAAFLDRHVNISACVARIGPGRSSLLFRGKVEGSIADVVKRARGAKPQQPLSIPEPTTAAPARSNAMPAAMPSPSPNPATPAPSIVSRLGHIQQEAHAAPASSTPSVGPGPLSDHVKSLTGTVINCPYEPLVELALDARGGLHLLVHAGSTAAASATSLMSVGGWAKSHAALIALALKGEGLHHDARLAPTLHLLTPHVKDHRGLINAGIRVHLLAPVEIEGRRGWFCTEVG